MDYYYDYLYKVILVGNSGVGKTSLILKYIDNIVDTKYNATIGIDFKVKFLTYSNSKIKLQIWDTAGQERFKSLIPSYLKDANCAIIVYDVTNKATLENS